MNDEKRLSDLEARMHAVDGKGLRKMTAWRWKPGSGHVPESTPLQVVLTIQGVAQDIWRFAHPGAVVEIPSIADKIIADHYPMLERAPLPVPPAPPAAGAK